MSLLFTAFLAAALSLEQTPPATAAGTTAATTGSVRAWSDRVKAYVTKAAAQVPEEHYAFQPTPQVRSMGQLFAHIADANFLICGIAGGQKPPMSGIEKSKTSKADISEALAASFKFCDSAFDGLTEATAHETVKFFVPGSHTRLGVLAFNGAHNFEHYGNIVTYMRMKGLVPPSSGGGN